MVPADPAAQSGVVVTASAAIDPATGWVRWTEMHANTWPWAD